MEFNRQTYISALWLLGLIVLSFVDNSDETIPLGLLKKIKNLDTAQFMREYVKQGHSSPVKPPNHHVIERPGYIDAPAPGEGPDGPPGLAPDELEGVGGMWNTHTGSITSMGADITAASIGDPTGCQPEDASVAVKSSNDPNIMYWPSCKRIPRCSGCCNSELMECVATRIAADQLSVAKLRYEPGQADFILESFEDIFLERHIECDCQCKVQSDDCDTEIHNYHEPSCQCKCKNEASRPACLEAQIWDDKICKCTCPQVYGCFEDEYFSNNTCRCEPSRGGVMSGQPNISPDVIVNPCLDTPIRCRPGMSPIPFGNTCECRMSSQWGDDLAALPQQIQQKPPLPPIDLVPEPTSHWERVPGHPQFHETTNPPTRPTRPPRRPRPRPRQRG